MAPSLLFPCPILDAALYGPGPTYLKDHLLQQQPVHQGMDHLSNEGQAGLPPSEEGPSLCWHPSFGTLTQEVQHHALSLCTFRRCVITELFQRAFDT